MFGVGSFSCRFLYIRFTRISSRPINNPAHPSPLQRHCHLSKRMCFGLNYLQEDNIIITSVHLHFLCSFEFIFTIYENTANDRITTQDFFLQAYKRCDVIIQLDNTT